MVNFKEFMEEERLISRWLVSIIFLVGMFAGATIGIVFMLSAIIP